MKSIHAQFRKTALASVNIKVWEFDASICPDEATALQLVEEGRCLRYQETHNKVVLSGRNLIRDAFLPGATLTPFWWFVLGTGNIAVTDSDVALAGQIWKTLFTGRTPGVASITLRYFLPATQLNGQTIREAGILTQNDILYARTVLSEEIPKTSTIATLFVWITDWEPKP